MSNPGLTAADSIRKPTPIDVGHVILLGIFWGSAFPAIKVLVGTYSPMHVVMIRVFLGAAILLCWLVFRRIPLPRDPAIWSMLALMGALNSVLPFYLISWGEQYVDAGAASLLMGSGPLLALLISHATTHDDRLSAPKLIGVSLGFTGVLTVIGPTAAQGMGSAVLGQLAIFSANVCYVVAGAMIRRIGNIPLEAMAAGNMLCAAILFLPAVWIIGPPDFGPMTGSVLIAALWLGAVPTGIAYLMRFYLVKNIGQSFMSLAAYLIPVSGVAISSLMLREPLSWQIVTALFLIVSGFAVARIR